MKDVKNKRLYSALEKEGIVDVVLVKGDGYFYLTSDNEDVFNSKISNIESNFIPVYALCHLSIDGWVNVIKSLLI